MILDVFSGDGDDSGIDIMSDEEEDVNNKIATECLKHKKRTSWTDDWMRRREDADMENIDVEDDGNANENEPEITM